MRNINKQAQQLIKIFFEKDNFPDTYALNKLAEETKVPYKTLQIWFQNMRAKRKRENTCQCVLAFTDKSVSLLHDTYFIRGRNGYLKTNSDIKVPIFEKSKINARECNVEIKNVNLNGKTFVGRRQHYRNHDNDLNMY